MLDMAGLLLVNLMGYLAIDISILLNDFATILLERCLNDGMRVRTYSRYLIF